AFAAADGELVEELDGAGVVVAGAGLDEPGSEHAGHDLSSSFGADDGEGPVVEGADAAGGDVGVLGGEVGAELAAGAGPGVALLEGDLVVAAVLHPDLEHAFDVGLLDVLAGEAVFGFEQL